MDPLTQGYRFGFGRLAFRSKANSVPGLPIIPQFQIPTASSSAEQGTSPPPQNLPRIVPYSIATGEEILAFFDNVPENWSGRGKHVEFMQNEAIPLREGASLGRGASADV